MESLQHAGPIDAAALGLRRVAQMPALRFAMLEVVEALVRAYGEDRRALVRYELQEKVQRSFGGYPPLIIPPAQAPGSITMATRTVRCAEQPRTD